MTMFCEGRKKATTIGTDAFEQVASVFVILSRRRDAVNVNVKVKINKR